MKHTKNRIKKEFNNLSTMYNKDKILNKDKIRTRILRRNKYSINDYSIKFRKNSLKRAVIFTLLSSLFATLFIVLFSYDFQIIYEDVSSANNMRIRVIDTYVKNFESYIKSSLKVSTYKTLDFLYRERLKLKKFYSNQNEFEFEFMSCMNCSYTNCTSKVTPCNLGLDFFINNITNSALNNFNIRTDYTINSIKIYQLHPFDVEVSVNISFTIFDDGDPNFASWKRNILVNETISIINLNDPLIGINSGVNRSIKKNTVCLYQACWNNDTAKVFFDNKEYRYYSNGSSYLQRFWNNTESSLCCGLETFLDNGIIDYSNFNSYVDIYYWTGEYTCTNTEISGLSESVEILQIDDIAPGFKLDSKTAARYSLINRSVLVCPTISP